VRPIQATAHRPFVAVSPRLVPPREAIKIYSPLHWVAQRKSFGSRRTRSAEQRNSTGRRLRRILARPRRAVGHNLLGGQRRVGAVPTTSITRCDMAGALPALR
jgi:hypothetical protein